MNLADTKSLLPEQSHFKNINRAPYELGHLLLQLPKHYSAIDGLKQDDLPVAVAAANHAENANSTVLSGLEAIGALMFSALSNEALPPTCQDLQGIASLIQHLAVEAQFLLEIHDELDFLVNKKR